MSNWYKFKKEANKEEFLIKQKPKSFSLEDWTKTVKWALGISKKHAIWLTNLMRRNPKEFIFGEDDQKVKEALDIFAKARKKREFEKKDLNQYKSYEELAEAIAPYKEVKSNREKERDARQEGLKLIDKDGEYSLYELLNFEAAHSVAQNTEWCVSWEENWYRYKNQGPLFYISKDNDPYSLMHSASRQFKNVSDAPMTDGATVPVLNLLEKHADKIGISQLFGKDSRNMSEDQTYGNDFGVVFAAAKEKEMINQIVEQSKTLDDFLNSSIINQIHKRFADVYDGTSDLFKEESKPKFWKELELLSSVEKKIPKGGMEAVIGFYSDHIFKKLQLAYNDEFNFSPGTLSHTPQDIDFANFVDSVSTMKNLTSQINKFPIAVIESENVRTSFAGFLENKIQDLAIRVSNFLEKLRPNEDLSYVHDTEWPLTDRGVGQIKSFNMQFLGLYNTIKDRFKTGKTVQLAKDLHSRMNEYLIKHNGLNERDYIKIHEKSTSDISDHMIKEGAKEAWKNFILKDPTVYAGGLYDDQAWGDHDPIKITPDLEKELAEYVNDFYIKMAHEPSDPDSTLSNMLSQKMQTNKEFMASVPVKLHTSPEFQEALVEVYENNTKAAGLGANYELENLFAYTKKSMLTPNIAKAIASAIKVWFSNVDYGVANKISVLNEFPDFIKELPAVKNEVINAFKSKYNEYDVQYTTLQRHPQNNNIRPGSIPDYVLEDKEFRELMTKKVLKHMTDRKGQDDNLITRNLFMFSRDSIDDYLPDFIVNHPSYQRAKEMNIVMLYRKNIGNLLHEKLRTPKELEEAKRKSKIIEEELNQLDISDSTRNLLEDQLIQSNQRIQTIEKMISDRAPMHSIPGVDKLWNQKIVKTFTEAVDNATSIFDKITDPMADFKHHNNIKSRVMEHLPRHVMDFPELKEKLKKLYEKDKEKINEYNFKNIDNVFRAIASEIDINERIASLVPNLNQIEFDLTKPLIEEYGQSVIEVTHKYYFTHVENPDMSPEAQIERDNLYYEMKNQHRELGYKFRERRKEIIGHKSEVPRVAWAFRFSSDTGFRNKIKQMIMEDRRKLAAYFYEKFDAITDTLPLQLEDARRRFKDEVYQQLREVFTVEYFENY